MIHPTLRYVEYSADSLAENLALDEALLLSAEHPVLSEPSSQGAELLGWLRVWESSQLAVVLGASGSIQRDVLVEACHRDGVTIGRRSSGGGTVLLGPGCLLFSLVLPISADPAYAQVRSSYAAILGRLASALSNLTVGVEVTVAGISDLAIGQLKFSGNAQQRKSRYLLHHGTLMYAMDLPRIGQYLRMPEHQPDYRAGRSHAEFVTNFPASAEQLRAILRQTFAAQPIADDTASRLPMELARARVAEQFGRQEWVFRR